VVFATFLDLPVSSTHCQVGGVVAVTWFVDGFANVSWGMVKKIFVTWIVTLPFSGGFAAVVTLLLRSSIAN
jgi:phosphate/sulfate permease